jgi:hypothetical protein
MATRFQTLQDWLGFCQQDAAPASEPVPEHTDEIQRAVRLLTGVLDRHEDAQQLANLWFPMCGSGRWRVISVIGKRARKADVS